MDREAYPPSNRYAWLRAHSIERRRHDDEEEEMKKAPSDGEEYPGLNDAKRILVNVTPTRNWAGVVEYAVRLAEKLGARLYVIDVIHDPFGLKGWNLGNLAVDEEYRRIVERARDRLKTIVAREKEKGSAIESFVREGDPVEQITGAIKELEIDLLIVPRHEENRLEHFLFGTVTDMLIRSMPCSIMFLKQAPSDQELIP
jgi:nucleotide-binding universal stress UspA family protein